MMTYMMTVYFQKPRAFQLPTMHRTIPSAPVRGFTSAWCFSNSWITSVGAEREQAALSGESLWMCIDRFDRTDLTMPKVEENTSDLNLKTQNIEKQKAADLSIKFHHGIIDLKNLRPSLPSFLAKFTWADFCPAWISFLHPQVSIIQ